MELIKIEKDNGLYDIKLINRGQELTMSLEGNGDLYMSITNGEKFDKDVRYNEYRFIQIDKEETELYEIFDNFYKCVVSKQNRPNDLVDDDWQIIWVSDDGIKELEDRLEISSYPEFYNLLFVRNNKFNDDYKCKKKSSRKIVIRFAASGSRYREFVSFFFDLYNRLSKVDVHTRTRKPNIEK